ncbi:MAG: CBS domain-containing protein [Gammaproteobacteria bacterium]
METQLRELLAQKSREVHSVASHVSVTEAVRDMNYFNIGALVVLERNRVVGIFSERDVLVRVVAADRDPLTTTVREVMTRNPVCVTPTMTVEAAMRLVTERRFRHLPVMHEGELLGLISSGDLTRWLVREQRHDIDELSAYITDTQVPPGFGTGAG